MSSILQQMKDQELSCDESVAVVRSSFLDPILLNFDRFLDFKTLLILSLWIFYPFTG